MQLTLADDVIVALILGIIVLAAAMGRSVAARDPRVSSYVAAFWIFFSAMWFIGPVTYLVFRKKYPLLARRCLQQLGVATVAFILMAIANDTLRSIPGAILPPESSPFDSQH